ncbi:acetate--CoA ligase family protein [Fundidesulfovibrio agrisoli]|uniref:acetate--CoA ligase family protein n=1 Tax=Fundidesulfovibrio agrisoli TaxID=2922717 RepID=UPI001FADD86D|nr:acetate--CoA ligase family protein [Fundidesulfovibrio agrisoli]
MERNDHLLSLLQPRTVAVVGASRTSGKIGNVVVANLLSAGYQGKIFPVNPFADEILGVPALHAIEQLPHGIDLAVVCLPREQLAPTLERLGGVGARSVCVTSTGFKEVGREGYYFEMEAVEVCRRHGIAMLGPSSLGLYNAALNCNALGVPAAPAPGNIGFFTQSGSLGMAILDATAGKGVGFSHFISLGNKAVVNETDVIRYLKDDPATKVILGYVENIEDGQAFLRAAQEATLEKPVIMIKSGATPEGARAASSHIGAMAGSEDACQAVFSQSGIMRVGGLREMFNLAVAFSSQPQPDGPNICVVTNSGGAGILAADALVRSSLVMAPLRGQTVDELKRFLASHASFYNPVDILGTSDAETFAKALAATAQDPLVHMLLPVVTPSCHADLEQVAWAIARQASECAKPVAACFLGDAATAPAREVLRKAGVPFYSSPEDAVSALDALFRHSEWMKRPLPVEICYMSNTFQAKDVLAKAKSRGFSELVEFQAMDVLKAYGLPVPKTVLARTSDEAAQAAKTIGYPVALKIASPQIAHKSDMGGVVLNIKGEADVRRAFMDVTNRASRIKEAYVMGCVVQQMAPPGSREVFAGFKRDPQFGPLVMFGLGGLYVEVLKDVSSRLAPLSLLDVGEMVREIRTYPLLRGVRGEPPVDFRAIEDVLLTLSQIAVDFPEIVECDFNPIMAHPGGALVVDAHFILGRRSNGD